MQIENIYKELKNCQLCESGYDFSENYLGKSKSYFSVLKARKELPSIEALVLLEVSLKEKARMFDDDGYEIYKIRRKQLLSMSEEVGRIRADRCKRRLSGLLYERTV